MDGDENDDPLQQVYVLGRVPPVSASVSGSQNIELNDEIEVTLENYLVPSSTAIEIIENTNDQKETDDTHLQISDSNFRNALDNFDTRRMSLNSHHGSFTIFRENDVIEANKANDDSAGKQMHSECNRTVNDTTTVMPVILAPTTLPAADAAAEVMITPGEGAMLTPKTNSPSMTSLTQNNSGSISTSIRSIGSLVCRICHNAENPERLVSPCLCKGSLTFVHINCLEHWMCTSGKTTCELCQYRYKTIQTLRYTCIQSLRMWYSRSVSRRALQEDCQLFSLLTLVVFGIIGTILVGIQYYYLNGYTFDLTMIWTQVWLVIFLIMTLIVYCVNVYMIVRSQLSPWYQWWQSARDIKLILENRRPHHTYRRKTSPKKNTKEVLIQPDVTTRKMNSMTVTNIGGTDCPVGSIMITQPTTIAAEQTNENCHNVLNYLDW